MLGRVSVRVSSRALVGFGIRPRQPQKQTAHGTRVSQHGDVQRQTGSSAADLRPARRALPLAQRPQPLLQHVLRQVLQPLLLRPRPPGCIPPPAG